MRMVTFLGTEFADSVNDFLKDNAPRVHREEGEGGQEHSLESYAVFKEYLVIVETKMEGFMKAEAGPIINCS